MGQRARRRRQAEAAAASAPSPPPARGYERGRQRDEEARAALKPLAPGERPGAVTAAAIVAALLAIANFVSWLAGVEFDGKRPGVVGVLAFCVLMGAAAVGIWRVRYWAVLGFQALLALIIVVFFLALLTASNVAALVVCLVVIAGAGFLFWKLIRAMARIQMPQRG
jgi:hypothetical protein